MRSRLFRWGRASTCSSGLAAAWLALAAATTVAAAERPAEIRLNLAELESGLAKKPDLYLELDPAAGHLAVKSRGIELARVPLVAMTRLEFRPLFGGGAVPPLPAPAIWTVTQGPGDTDRETIAPTTLRPYTEDDAKAEPTPSSPGPPAAKKPGEEDKPSSYRVMLDNGWQLLLVNEPPRLGWWRRLVAAVTDGWLRVRGLEPSHPPLVALVVAPDDARRLHHLFRTGMAILVAPPS